MADQDPPVGPLRRLDPSEPDEPQELGRLEPLDPEADEAPASSAPPPPAYRPRSGLALAVALAVLLSLSSIAAIGGLVAISVRTLGPAPEPAITSPIESAANGPTIRVVERAAGADSPRDAATRDQAPESEQSLQAGVAPPPAPAVAPEPAPRGSGKTKEDSDKAGGRRAPRSVGGGWCDATAGTTCDVVVGGTTTHSADEAAQLDGSGFIRSDEDGDDEDDDSHGKHGKHD